MNLILGLGSGIGGLFGTRSGMDTEFGRLDGRGSGVTQKDSK